MDSSKPIPLSLSETYPCPVCRQGQIAELVLTEAFSCELCRHILSADLKQQQVQVVDSSQSLTWRWNGQRWKLVYGRDTDEMSGLVLATAIVLTVFPAGLVWLSGAIFPPLTSPSQIPFSRIWAFITLLAHLCFVLWLIAEYYQISFYIAARMRLLRRSAVRYLGRLGTP